MNPIVASLLEFNEAFEIPKLDAPGLGPEEMIELRIKLLKEEGWQPPQLAQFLQE